MVKDKNSEGKHKLSRRIIAVIASVATLFTTAAVASTASAAGINGNPGYWYNPFSDGTVTAGYHGSSLSVQAWDGDNPVYCIEAGTPLGATDGSWAVATDSNSVIAANMAIQNKGDHSDLTQAAVAYAIHDHLDKPYGVDGSTGQWAVYKNHSLEGGDMGAVAAKAGQLWTKAANSIPANAKMSQQYTQGKRTGTVAVGIFTGSGALVDGLNYTATISGPAVFDATGNQSQSGTINGAEQHLAWHATGNGTATAKVTYSIPRGSSLKPSSQWLFKPDKDPENRTADVQFEVRKDFQPTVTTQVSAKELNRGQTIQDKVTSGVDTTGDNAGGEWNAGTKVTAKGYYFTGSSAKIFQTINQSGNVNSPENPDDYLKTVEGKLGNPVATATTTFTGNNQTNTVTAKDANGNDYVNPEDGVFGGWLWVIKKSDQAAADQDYIKNNFIDTFGKAQETDVHTRTPAVWSEVNEPHAQTGSDVRDVLHITGLPKDFGSFAGSSAYGFDKDNTTLTVQVWWAGATGGNAGVQEEDMKYVPSTTAAPKADDNHKLVKTVTYNMADLIKAMGANYNGTLDIKVAGGTSGDPLADGSHFSISADNTGYYTFVASYTGSPRVKAFSTPYNDQFESTFVTKPKVTVALSSNTNPDTVRVAEEFWDTATISGDNNVTEGAYVTFDAYNPVPGNPDPSVGKIISNDKHVLTADQLQKLHAGYQVDVESTHVKSQSAGIVYWQAALHAANGTILATHPLGVKSESTTVKGGGYVSSVAQTQGAVGGQMWDIITVGDQTTGDNRGNIPDGSKVKVDVYKHEGQDDATKGQLVDTKTFNVDTSKLGTRPGKYNFKALMNKTYPAAGQYNWVATLIAPDGSTIDAGKYGEDTERTFVQDYSTDAAKKWLSDNNKDYSQSTTKTYDVMTQNLYKQWGSDGESEAKRGQTMPGTTATFSINQEGANADADKTVLTGKGIDLYAFKIAGDKTSQKIKSETFTMPASATPGTYYYGLKVANSVDAANLKNLVGEDSDGVFYTAPKRVASESFDVVKVTSKSSETTWVDTQKHVEDTLSVDGNLPAGSKYEVEVWQRDDSGKAVKQVSTSGIQTLKTAIKGSGTIKVSVATPKYGSYQFRHKVWAPDGQGGDPKVPDAAGVVSDNWKVSPDPSAGYSDNPLLYEGDNVASERFEVINISTDVTGTTGVNTASNGKHYVDTTDGAKVNDHAIIKGNIPAGFKLGFNLYKQASGTDASKDTLVKSIAPVDVAAATKALDSATADLSDYGEFYWETVFTKADGSAWAPDGEKQVVSAARVPSETFYAVRVTTSTNKWSSKGGVATDTALIEGCLPKDSTITFDLHEYKSQKQVGTTNSKLSDLGYKDCTDGNSTQSVTSKEVKVPDSIDYYWVESIKVPGVPTDFHRGHDRVPHESTRAIDATTSVSAEFSKGTAVSDHTVFANIKYSKDGDIRDDLKASLKASWELWKQDSGNDPAKDKLITTVNKDGVPLADGQKTADSDKYTPTEVGIYYWRIRVSDPDGKLIKYGAPRDLAETFRIINSYSKTAQVVADGKAITDSVTIEGPVAEGTMVSWEAYKKGTGDASKDTKILSYDTPANGAVLISKDEAAKALKDGKITVTTPKPYTGAKPGDIIYWVFSLTSPAKNADGSLKTPVKDADGNYTTDHLVHNDSDDVITPQDADKDDADTEPAKDDSEDNTKDQPEVYAAADENGSADANADAKDDSNADAKDDTPADNKDDSKDAADKAVSVIAPFFTDKVRVKDETAYVIDVTTKTTPDATVGDKIHDTALIKGTVPDGYCIKFEYWAQDKGTDVKKDKLETTTSCVKVPAGATEVQSPVVVAKTAGTHYFRERMIPDTPVTPNTPDVHYGKPRVPGETVNVKQPPLAKTGLGLTVLSIVSVLALGAGMAFVSLSRKRRI